MYQAGELPATLRVSEVHYEPPKTVCNFTHSETPYASISRLQWKMVTGLGALSQKRRRLDEIREDQAPQQRAIWRALKAGESSLQTFY